MEPNLHSDTKDMMMLYFQEIADNYKNGVINTLPNKNEIVGGLSSILEQPVQRTRELYANFSKNCCDDLKQYGIGINEFGNLTRNGLELSPEVTMALEYSKK